jgi:hypothetical protein
MPWAPKIDDRRHGWCRKVVCPCWHIDDDMTTYWTHDIVLLVDIMFYVVQETCCVHLMLTSVQHNRQTFVVHVV